jgi:hypothetical protein
MVCILLVLITYVDQNARFKKRKVFFFFVIGMVPKTGARAPPFKSIPVHYLLISY